MQSNALKSFTRRTFNSTDKKSCIKQNHLHQKHLFKNVPMSSKEDALFVDCFELSKLALKFQTQNKGPGLLWNEITALSREPGVIDLGQGYSDFGASSIAKQHAKRAISSDEKTLTGAVIDPRANQYAPIPGSTDLLEAVERYYKETTTSDRGDSDAILIDCERDKALVTTSATEALYVIFRALLDRGDEVMTCSPFFPWYLAHATVTESTLIDVPLVAEDGFVLTEEMLDLAWEKSEKKVKIFVHCSPHNPTGHVSSEAELKAIANFCRRNNVVALADEVYERTTFFTNKPHLRLRDYLPERTVTIGTASKLFNLSGWRIGWIYGNRKLIDSCNTFHSYASFSSPTPLQAGVAEALNSICDERERGKKKRAVWPDGNAQILQENATILAEALTSSGCKVYPCEGGFFLVASVKNIKSIQGDAVKYCKKLAREGALVSAVPLTPFYNPDNGDSNPTDLVRFAICKRRETILEAARRIKEFPL